MTERMIKMPEYIECETALQIIDNYAKTVSEDGLVVVNAIKDIINIICPTIDVVRCKDCKHWIGGFTGSTENVKRCEYAHYLVGGNGYCVYGEAKEKKE